MDNLFRRGIIQANAQFCVSGNGSIENVDHLFPDCEIYLLEFGRLRRNG